ncbi:MAG: DUF4105 domain-containing protein [Cocleimonas sp.]
MFVAISFVIYSLTNPSNNKNWSLGNSKTASIEINEGQVVINNFRDADWQNLDSASLKNDDGLFKDIEFKLSDIQSLKAVVSHFAPLSEIAHIFIMFELKDSTVIGLSVEARKELGEEYSLSGGLSAKFELIYLLASYRDIVGIRLMRNEDVYSYPIKATAEEAQSLFKVVAARTNKIDKEPELYHLFLKNCTTEIVKLVNQIADNEFPRLTQSFMPGDAGKALYKMNLIDSDAINFNDIQKASLIKK